jgi:hypothetical protein
LGTCGTAGKRKRASTYIFRESEKKMLVAAVSSPSGKSLLKLSVSVSKFDVISLG